MSEECSMDAVGRYGHSWSREVQSGGDAEGRAQGELPLHTYTPALLKLTEVVRVWMQAMRIIVYVEEC